jgi:hypothetical protein
MYVVFAEELEDIASVGANTVPTLADAFARIACRCGLSYRFVSRGEGWTLELMDVERPECSPEPIHSNYVKPRDAQSDLMTQAVDGRIRGHIALDAEIFSAARMVRNDQSLHACAQ